VRPATTSPKPVAEKNPFAVRLGERIKQARRMAGFDNVEKLLEVLPGWNDKRSRLTNYEAGISLAPPDVVLQIARVTGCSECWLMFGSGPIRATGRDLQAIRHQNLTHTMEQARAARKLNTLLSTIGLSPAKLDELVANPFLPISDRIARRCEKYLGKPAHWLDEQHVENDPVCQSFPEDMQELMTIYSELEGKQRILLLEIGRVLRAQRQ